MFAFITSRLTSITFILWRYSFEREEISDRSPVLCTRHSVSRVIKVLVCKAKIVKLLTIGTTLCNDLLWSFCDVGMRMQRNILFSCLLFCSCPHLKIQCTSLSWMIRLPPRAPRQTTPAPLRGE